MTGRRQLCARCLLYVTTGLWTVLLLAGIPLGLAVHHNFFFLSLLGMLLLAVSCPLYCILQTCQQQPTTAPESPPYQEDSPPAYEALFVCSDDPPPSYDKALQFTNLPRVHLTALSPKRQSRRAVGSDKLKV
ncbi:unnamed protein product [Ixodes hexagonus]